jgi:cobalt-zinc-cadmium efflux system outer membrane protein
MATAQKIVARQFPNPTLSASTAQINTDSHPNSTISGNGLWNRNYDTIFAVSQLFEVGGKRQNRRISAEAGIKGAQARFEDARRVLNQAVTKNYIDTLLGGANVAILNDSAKSLRQEAQIAETRLNAGDISKAERSQIEIAAERLEMQAKAAEAAATTARIAVEVLLGEPHPTGKWAPGDTLDSLASQSTLTSQATPGAPRPDLVAAEAARAKADADLRLQKALRIPDPTVFMQYEHEPPDLPNALGFGVSFPLPLWNRNRGGIAGAKAAQEQARLQAAKVQGQIQAEIANARVAYTDAATRWQRHRDEIVPKSAGVRQTVSFAYEKGGASLLDLLSAQRTDNEVRLATAQAAAEAAKAAADLKAALNVDLNAPAR